MKNSPAMWRFVKILSPSVNISLHEFTVRSKVFHEVLLPDHLALWRYQPKIAVKGLMAH